MMLKYVCSKPTGGGPAPLIHNPVLQWIKALIGLHVVLFLTASAVFAFPSMGDLYCPDLLSNATYCTSCGVVAFTMTFYFSLMACRTWGTEREWATASIVTMTMAILDLVTAIWGILVLVDSSNSMTAHQQQQTGTTTDTGNTGNDTSLALFLANSAVGEEKAVGGMTLSMLSSGYLPLLGEEEEERGFAKDILLREERERRRRRKEKEEEERGDVRRSYGGSSRGGEKIIFVSEEQKQGESSSSSSSNENLDCQEWKAYFYYYATASLITLHVTIALFCALVSIFLAQGVGAQLEECRRLV
ncbi:membrane protein [Cystoisospora suis]|uniref:Membrane protein n=1 Tax=Cystoisospora suis TaxID=483139 RepID=A0A2C6L3X7_9APIC|nr:membrane protein [Cystoisospora suis]